MRHFALKTAIIMLGSAALGHASPPSAAPAPCDCDRYRDLKGIQSLGKLVGQIGMTAIRYDGRTFSFTPEEVSALRLQTLSDASIPPECREEALKDQDKRWSIVLQPFFDPRSFKSNWSEGGSKLAQQDEFISYVSQHSCDKHAPDNLPEWCKEKDRLKRNDLYLQSTKPDEVIKEAQSLAAGNAKLTQQMMSAQEIKLFTAYQHIVLEDSTQALTYLRSVRGQFTTDEKISLVTMIGKRFELGYDVKRTDFSNPRGQGSVALGALLDAAEHNMRINFYDQAGKTPSDAQFAGVCRDIATAQADMLDALGMKNSLVVAYVTARGGHVAVISQDPDNPKKTIKIDYNESEVVEGTEGGVALHQGSLHGTALDTTSEYKLYRPGGGLVAITPSKYQEVMSATSGFDVQTIYPLARVNASVAGATVKLDPRGDSQLRAYTARDATGANYLGVGGTQAFGIGSATPSKLGFSLGVQQTSKDVSKTDRDMALGFLHLQAEQKARTPRLTPLTSPLDLYVDSGTNAFIHYNHDLDLSKGAYSVDGNVIQNIGIRADAGGGTPRRKADRVQASLYGGVQLAPGFKDIRDEGMDPRLFELSMINAILSLENRVRLTDDEKNYLGMLALGVCNQLGCRGKGEVSVVLNDLAASVAVQGRINENMPFYQDGTRREISANLMYSVFSDPTLLMRISAQHSLETQDDRVMSNIEKRF